MMRENKRSKIHQKKLFINKMSLLLAYLQDPPSSRSRSILTAKAQKVAISAILRIKTEKASSLQAPQISKIAFLLEPNYGPNASPMRPQCVLEAFPMRPQCVPIAPHCIPTASPLRPQSVP